MKIILQTQNLKNVKILAAAAFFAAISFVCGKFLAFNIGDTIRFSFENLPLMLVGILFGPTVGVVTAITADIIGCLLRGYAINPILTLAAAFIGFASGFVFNVLKTSKLTFRVTCSVVICHAIGSIIIKSIGLSIWYSLPFYITLIERSVNYLIVAAVELSILLILLKNKSFYNQMAKITGVKNEI